MQDMPSMNRRTFVKSTGALGACCRRRRRCNGCEPVRRNRAGARGVRGEDHVGHCAINCPGRCSLKFHVKDDEVVWVDTCTSKDAGSMTRSPVRACAVVRIVVG